MSFWLKEGVRAKVKKVVEVKDKFTVVHLATSEKRFGEEDVYDWSNWSYARLVGKAHKIGVSEGTTIVLNSAKVSFVSYKVDDKWKNPSSPLVTVFDCGLYTPNGGGQRSNQTEFPTLPPEDDVPF